MTDRAIADIDLYDHVKTAMHAARELVVERVGSGRRVPSYNEWPTLGSVGPGWPSVSHSQFGGGPPDYGGLFARTANDLKPFGFDDVSGLGQLFAFARGHERLRTFLGRPDLKPSEQLDDSFELVVASQVFNLLDRTIHLFGLSFTDDDFTQPYSELERAWLSAEVPVEIWVPLALTRLEADEFDLDLGIAVRKIPEGLQLARIPSTVFGGAVHECILDAATHALVLSGWKIENTNYWLRVSGETLVREPPEQLTQVFTALRLAGVETGWAQIFLRPVGWAIRWKANLPPIATGGLARRYPPQWDEYGWLKEHARADEAMASAADLLPAMDKLPKALRLALKRLDAAMLRAEEEDSIIDLMIALEAALGDQSRSEMTHKLSLRVAALLARTNGRPAADTFQTMKKLYDYRSTIAHGGDTTKVRAMRDQEGRTVPIAPLAAQLTRETLSALVRNAQWQEPQRIDEALLLQSIHDAASTT